MGETTLRFEILGPVRAYRGGQALDVGPVKQQALLALLLLNAGRAVPMQQIVGALWGGDPPGNPVDVVQRYVGALRRELDPERTSLIALVDGGYVMRVGPEAVDAGVLRAAADRAGAGGPHAEELQEVLGRCAGEPLAGLTGMVFEGARARLVAERNAASRLLARPAQPEPAAKNVAPSVPAPTRAERPQPERTRVERPQPDRTRVEHPQPDPTRVDHPRPDYPEPTDPWAGHDLFPPDRGW